MSDEKAGSALPRSVARWSIASLAVVGLVAIIILLFLFVTFSSFFFADQRPRVVAAGPKQETLVVGTIAHLPGTNLVRIDIQNSADGGGSGRPYSSSGGALIRNIVLLDEATGQSRKILPDNSQIIYDADFLPAEKSAGGGLRHGYEVGPITSEDSPASYFALTLGHEKDDKIDVLVGRLSDGGQSLVMRDLDGVDRIWMQEPNAMALLVREKQTLHYRLVDMGTLRVTASHPIRID